MIGHVTVEARMSLMRVHRRRRTENPRTVALIVDAIQVQMRTDGGALAVVVLLPFILFETAGVSLESRAQVACVAMIHEPELKPSGWCLAVSYKCV